MKKNNIMQNIKKHWNNIEKWLEENVPIKKSEWNFMKPATISEIINAEKEFGFLLPQDYKDFLGIHNGQSYEYLFTWMFDGMTFLPINEVVNEWKNKLKYCELGSDFFNETNIDDRIRNIMFHQKRITIAEQEGISMLMLDFVPTDKGTKGQLIYNIDECEFIIVAESFSEFLEKYYKLLQKGVFYFDTENMQIILKDHENNPHYEGVF